MNKIKNNMPLPKKKLFDQLTLHGEINRDWLSENGYILSSMERDTKGPVFIFRRPRKTDYQVGDSVWYESIGNPRPDVWAEVSVEAVIIGQRLNSDQPYRIQLLATIFPHDTGDKSWVSPFCLRHRDDGEAGESVAVRLTPDDLEDDDEPEPIGQA